MRIGELAVIGPHTEEKTAFIKSVTSSIEQVDEKITFGQYRINNQLMIHLYGIALTAEDDRIVWDLISSKLLGYIAIFKWGDADSFRKVQALVQYLNAKFNAFIVVAAHTRRTAPPLPAAFEFGVPIDKTGAFTFCDVYDEKSVRKVLVALIEKIIDQLV